MAKNNKEIPKGYKEIKPIPDLKLNDIVSDACYYADYEPKEYFFDVHPMSYRRQVCPVCHQYTYHKDGTVDPRVVHDLSIGGTQVRIRAEIMRYKCMNEACIKHPKFRHQYTSFMPKYQLTVRLYNYIKCKSFSSSFKELSRKFGINQKTVSKIFLEATDELDITKELSAPTFLGIDKIQIGKQECLVFTCLDDGSLIEIIDDTSIKAICNIIQKMDGYEHIKEISIGIDTLYCEEAIRKILPNVLFYIDKWHLINGLSKSFSIVYEAILENEEKISKQVADEKERKKIKKRVKEAQNWNDLFLLENCDHIRSMDDLDKQNKVCHNFPSINLFKSWMDGLIELYNYKDPESATEYLRKWNSLKYQYPLLDGINAEKINSIIRNCETELIQYFKSEYRHFHSYISTLMGVINEINRRSYGSNYDIMRRKLIYGGYIKTSLNNEYTLSKDYSADSVLKFMGSDDPYYIYIYPYCFYREYNQFACIDQLQELYSNGYFEDLY